MSDQIGRIRIADLATTSSVDKDSYVIIEKPGIGDGTYKSTVSQLQEAITVKAKVEQFDNITKISIDDINGHTEEEVFAPTAKIIDNNDGTITIIITDGEGQTQSTIVKDASIIDSQPVEGSNHFVTSGTIFDVQETLKNEIQLAKQEVLAEIAAAEDRLNDRIDKSNQRIDLLEALLEITYYTSLLDDNSEYITTESDDELIVPVRGTVSEMKADPDGYLEEVFTVDGKPCMSLTDAINQAKDHGGEIKLLSDAISYGVIISQNSNFILDLNGFTLEIVNPGVDRNNISEIGLQVLEDSNVVIKNGILIFEDTMLDIGIQTYSSITLSKVKVIGGPSIKYLVESYFGNTVFKDGTHLTASDDNVTFNCYYGILPEYDTGVHVLIEDDSVIVDGRAEFGKDARATDEGFAANACIACPADMELTVTLLDEPCRWNYRDKYKFLHYIIN